MLLLALDLLFCFADEELPPFVRPCMVVVSLPPPGTPEFVVELTSDTMCIFSSGFKGWTQTEEGTLPLIHLTSLTLVPLMDLPRLHQSQEHQRNSHVRDTCHRNFAQLQSICDTREKTKKGSAKDYFNKHWRRGRSTSSGNIHIKDSFIIRVPSRVAHTITWHGFWFFLFLTLGWCEGVLCLSRWDMEFFLKIL